MKVFKGSYLLVIVRMIANCVAVTLPVALIRVCQCTDYRCTAVACEDVIDFEGNGLRQRADNPATANCTN
jgi:hypothetical protein